MPYIVAIYVKDLNKARSLINTCSQTKVGKAVGVYSLPKKEDEEVCPGFLGGCRKTAWSRDPARGHIIHACGRRRKDWRARIAGSLFDNFGINLMPRDKTPVMFQNPELWDAPTKKRPHPEG